MSVNIPKLWLWYYSATLQTIQCQDMPCYANAKSGTHTPTNDTATAAVSASAPKPKREECGLQWFDVGLIDRNRTGLSDVWHSIYLLIFPGYYTSDCEISFLTDVTHVFHFLEIHSLRDPLRPENNFQLDFFHIPITISVVALD